MKKPMAKNKVLLVNKANLLFYAAASFTFSAVNFGIGVAAAHHASTQASTQTQAQASTINWEQWKEERCTITLHKNSIGSLKMMAALLVFSAITGLINLICIIIGVFTKGSVSSVNLNQLIYKAEFCICKHVIIVGIFFLMIPVEVGYLITLLGETGIFCIRFLVVDRLYSVDKLEPEKEISELPPIITIQKPMAENKILPEEPEESTGITCHVIFSVVSFGIGLTAILIWCTLNLKKCNIYNSSESRFLMMGIALVTNALIGFISLACLIVGRFSKENMAAVNLNQLLDKVQFHICKHAIIVGILILFCFSPVKEWHVILFFIGAVMFLFRFHTLVFSYICGMLEPEKKISELPLQKEISQKEIPQKEIVISQKEIPQTRYLNCHEK